MASEAASPAARPIPRRTVKNSALIEEGRRPLLFAISLAGLLLLVATTIDLGRMSTGQSRLENVMHFGTARAYAGNWLEGLDRWMKESGQSDEVREAWAAARMADAERRARLIARRSMTTAERRMASMETKTEVASAAPQDTAGDGNEPETLPLSKQPPHSIEVALVLDTSRAVAGPRLAELKSTAARIIERVLEEHGSAGTARVALVPFAAAVNVGADAASQPWIDTTSASSEVDGGRSALGLFKSLGVPWAGCVAARAGDLDVLDTEPDTAKRATLFSPLFAPDEPDAVNSGGYPYANSYLRDSGGSCAGAGRTCTAQSKRGECLSFVASPLDPPMAQRRACKYDVARAVFAPGTGPNAGCTSAAIVPLTSDKARLLDTIASLSANGDANIAEGMMWGWRALSPEAPLTEGKPYGVPGHTKLVVIISPGLSSHTTAANHNRSVHGAYGYVSAGRLGTDDNASGLALRLDSRLAAACANAKAVGVKIATVDLRQAGESGLDSVLAQCASEPDLSVALSRYDGKSDAVKTLARLFPRSGRPG